MKCRAQKVVFALFTSQVKENEWQFLPYSYFWFLPCSNPYPSYARDYQIAALRNDECSSIDGVRSPAKEALSKRSNEANLDEEAGHCLGSSEYDEGIV